MYCANREGLTAFHLLLGKLVELTGLENKTVQARGPKVPPKQIINYESKWATFVLSRDLKKVLIHILRKLIHAGYDNFLFERAE